MTSDDLKSEFERAWAACQTLTSLRLVEDTLESEWKRGRSEYLAFLIPIEDAAVRAYCTRIVDRIAPIQGVEPYPQSYWHVTVKGLGFQTKDGSRRDELSQSDVDRIAAAAQPIVSTTASFEMQAGRIALFPEVVIVEAWDSLPVRDLNSSLLERIPDLIRYPFDGSAFLPHISIARFTSSDGLPQLKEAIASLRDEQAGPPFRVAQVDLIRAHLSARAPTFEAIASYPLANPH